MGLPEVIRVNKEKCKHCLACLLVCPVKLCNIVEPDGITVKADLCIGCGECIRACREKGHKARTIVDDFPEFLQGVQLKNPVGVLIAPSAAVNYEHLLPQVLTALRNLGVQHIFDVSFGAEITTYLYLQALKSAAKLPIIAQPCPAIVSFIEIYQTELIPYLAPTQSPALDVAVWLKSQPEFQHLKLAFLGPCLAKRREIHDPNTKGLVSYNITFDSIDKYFLEQGINLAELDPSDFDTPEAERAVGYCQPGGLTDTFNRFGLSIKKSDIPRVEGPQEVYLNYLPELSQDILRDKAPMLVDILNCKYGCNVGPAVTHKLTHFQIERIIEERKDKQITKHQSMTSDAKDLFKDFYRWIETQALDFSRVYSDKSSNNFLREPTVDEEEQVWNLMHKLTPEEREINCASCGYGNCKAMMNAVVNGLNHLDSCKYYLFKENEYKSIELALVNNRLQSDLELAATIQKQLLPQTLPVAPEVNFAWQLIPCSYVAGDMLNIATLDEYHIAFYLLDVVGHGVSAALTASAISYFLKPTIELSTPTSKFMNYDLIRKPSKLMGFLNDHFVDYSNNGHFFTIIYGVLNTKTLDLTYVRAGHCPLILLSKQGDVRILSEGDLPIGLIQHTEYVDLHLKLNSGDKLILYTDGIIEALNTDEGCYTQQRLIDLTILNNNQSISELVTTIIRDVLSYADNQKPKDDISILGLEITS